MAAGKPAVDNGAKRVRDEQMEALVRSRDAAVQKAKAAEAEAAKSRQHAETAAALQQQNDALRGTLAALEGQLSESRQFELQMARITSSLERERDLLQREVLKYASAEPAEQLAERVRQLQAELEKAQCEKQRLREDAILLARLHQDQLDAEQVRNNGLEDQLEYLRGTMGSGIEVTLFRPSAVFFVDFWLQDLRVQMEAGLRMALARVDHMEGLLWAERAKTKKYLQLLTQLVDKDDLEVLLDEDGDEDAKK